MLSELLQVPQLTAVLALGFCYPWEVLLQERVKLFTQRLELSDSQKWQLVVYFWESLLDVLCRSTTFSISGCGSHYLISCHCHQVWVMFICGTERCFYVTVNLLGLLIICYPNVFLWCWIPWDTIRYHIDPPQEVSYVESVHEHSNWTNFFSFFFIYLQELCPRIFLLVVYGWPKLVNLAFSIQPSSMTSTHKPKPKLLQWVHNVSPPHWWRRILLRQTSDDLSNI